MDLQEKYYAYWGLVKPPFDNAPDPEMYFDLHRSVENAVAEILFTIEEHDTCLAVIIGDVGLGKTMALRVVLDSLEQEKYEVAFIVNPDMTYIQLLKEIVRQLSGELCSEKRRAQLLEMFNKLLFKTQAEGKKVLIFIDGAHAMKPSALERLRLLTNMEGGDANLFTIILAGQIELARRLEHPRCANLFQRIGIYCHLATIESQDLMRDYIEHRLARAGTSRRIFTDDAYNAIWEYSENGVPRLINKIAKRALKMGQTQALETIDADVVRQIVSHLAGASHAIAPECRECGRDASSVMRELFNTPTMHEEPRLSTPRIPAASLSPVDEPASRSENASGIDEGAAPVAATADQQPKQFPMAGMIKFPEHVHLKAKELPADERLKLAGQLAAEMLKRHPHLIQQLGSTNDPVPAWTILRNVVMRQLDHYPAS